MLAHIGELRCMIHGIRMHTYEWTLLNWLKWNISTSELPQGLDSFLSKPPEKKLNVATVRVGVEELDC